MAKLYICNETFSTLITRLVFWWKKRSHNLNTFKNIWKMVSIITSWIKLLIIFKNLATVYITITRYYFSKLIFKWWEIFLHNEKWQLFDLWYILYFLGNVCKYAVGFSINIWIIFNKVLHDKTMGSQDIFVRHLFRYFNSMDHRGTLVRSTTPWTQWFIDWFEF